VKIVTVVLYFAVASPRAVDWWFVLRTLSVEALLALIVAPAVFAALGYYLPHPRSHAAE
jgi:hypothetical protein